MIHLANQVNLGYKIVFKNSISNTFGKFQYSILNNIVHWSKNLNLVSNLSLIYFNHFAAFGIAHLNEPSQKFKMHLALTNQITIWIQYHYAPFGYFVYSKTLFQYFHYVKTPFLVSLHFKWLFFNTYPNTHSNVSFRLQISNHNFKWQSKYFCSNITILNVAIQIHEPNGPLAFHYFLCQI